ncbi:MAG TPA: multicopper oxidase domain-containing protein [Ktedonosporobacter sp.]|nr:multicopper oxidase domain-containing protein [Ktedonosporobacter sp.]
MSKENQPEQDAAPHTGDPTNTAEHSIGIFTRQPRSTMSRIAFWTLLITAILGAAGSIALHIFAGGSIDADVATTVALLATILVWTRIRWLQALGAVGGAILIYLFLTQPFVIESLAQPRADPNGGFYHFVGQLVPIALTCIGLAATIAAVLQNYRSIARKTPRWFPVVSSAVGGMVAGSVFIGALAPGPVIPTVPPLQAPAISSGPGVPIAMNMGMPHAPTSLTQLQDPQTATRVDRFTLTAQPAHLTMSSGVSLPAWTFNGTSPGPTLHVRQGDEVVVTLVNHLSFGVTIHWHGVRVANASDGVAGVTQDAVKPGQSYVYHFTPLDAGTYWYHSHQFSEEETTNGLFGMLIVDPATPTIHADVDTTVALHTWNGPNNQPLYTMNSTDGTLNKAARPGQWVRLRIVNTAETPTGNPQLVTLVGAPFQVVSLDGHDLNGPQQLTQTPLPIGAAQRYDLFFQMPVSGSVALVTADDGSSYVQTPALIIGQGSLPAKLPAVTKWFDLTTYGTPTADPVTPQSHFDTTYSIVLSNQLGTSLGRSGMTYMLNGKIFPDTAMLMVKEGQLIKLHFDNQTNLYHPMHLHGHIMTVLTQNGQPLSGSPVHLDTVLVPPHMTYDVAFVANNPGVWMLHCHNFLHANWGMDMMVTYNVSTPYTIGTASGNFPD